MPHIEGDKLVALVTLLLVIVTVASIVATLLIAKHQEALQTSLDKNQKAFQTGVPTVNHVRPY